MPGLLLCLVLGLSLGCSHATVQNSSATWSPKLAAEYLDEREVTWMSWPPAFRDHDTFCISCHTNLPYALSRPALRTILSEKDLTPSQQKLLTDVSKRVRMWKDVDPFYGDKNYADAAASVKSRGTESVLNALILALYDVSGGHLSETTREAFNNMWALQVTDGGDRGAWHWLQSGFEPWEASDSPYYGAVLAAMAVAIAPDQYRSTPQIQEQVNQLRDYLDREYSEQSTINHVMLLWASAKWPGLIDAARRKAILNELTERQQADGGWRLSSLAWPHGSAVRSILRGYWRPDWTRQDTASDGYATGLITLALLQTGMPVNDLRVSRSLAWLARNQDSEGSWPSQSINKRRPSSSHIGHFMRDAATAYSVLALIEAREAGPTVAAANH